MVLLLIILISVSIVICWLTTILIVAVYSILFSNIDKYSRSQLLLMGMMIATTLSFLCPVAWYIAKYLRKEKDTLY